MECISSYADDIVLTAPSLKGLQKLIDSPKLISLLKDILGESITNISININVKKSNYIV